MRPVTDLCEVCGQAAPVKGLGFSEWAKDHPGLRIELLGACIWICRNPACHARATLRAMDAAEKGGARLTQIFTTHLFPPSQGKNPC